MSANSQQEMHARAETLLDRKDVAGARAVYARICEISPDDAEAWLMLGSIDSESGNYEAALSALCTAINYNPELTEAHFNLAVLLAISGNLNAAAESCEKTVRLESDHKDAWLLLSTIHGRQGEFQRAASCARQALSIDPESIEATTKLGLVLTSSGQYQEALQVYLQAVRQHPTNSLLWASLGEVYHALGKQNDVLRCFLRAAELNPTNHRILQALAGLYLELGQPDKASAACRAILASAPDQVATLSMLGTAHQMMGNLREATKCLGRAVTLQPDNTENTYKLACACQALGEIDLAMKHFKRTLELEPGSATAIGGLVRIHNQKGDIDAVKHLLPDLIKGADRNPLVLPTLASIAPKFDLEDVCLNKLLQALDRPSIPAAVGARLHWAAGSLLDHLGDFDTAFDHHRASKALIKVHYDTNAHRAYIDRIISTFSRDFLDSAPSPLQSSELPVFIIGMPRSGTSLVEQILASHAQVFGAGELDTLANIVQTMSTRTGGGQRFPECCQRLTTDTINSAMADYLNVIRRLSSGASRITDKMPHNFLHLGLIQLLFPAARIIHVSRNPLDTCLSCFFQEFSNAHAYSRTLDDLGTHYRDYQRLMDHWKQVLQIPLLQLQYEDLVESPERVMHDLTEFCGLPWDPACAEFYMSDRIVTTLSSAQVREPLNRNSIGRWRHYEKHLGALMNILGSH